MKVGGLVALVLLVAGCDNPVPLTAAVATSATQNVAVGGLAQLVVKVTNTGPSIIPHLGLVFMTADKWYEHHTVSDFGGCSLAADSSAFDCGDLGVGVTASFVIVGSAREAGTFNYELALRELARPFDFVNDHPDGADLQKWVETITPG
jgi:hypothetical protein